MSGSTVNLGARIPQPSVSFLSQDGGISREWLYYMISMLERTGGNIGISSANLQQEIANLQQQIVVGNAQAVLDLEGDVMEALPSIPLAILLSSALYDDVPRAPLNPFLAALIVADAT